MIDVELAERQHQEVLASAHGANRLARVAIIIAIVALLLQGVQSLLQWKNRRAKTVSQQAASSVPGDQGGASEAQKNTFRTELKDLLVDCEQLDLSAQEMVKNYVLLDRAKQQRETSDDIADYNEAANYERELNRIRPTFTSKFRTVKTRFDFMKFPSPGTGRAELARAVDAWEKMSTSYSSAISQRAAAEAAIEFSDAKRLLQSYF
jgi:hypothetical protein